jgi:hypothetical protein
LGSSSQNKNPAEISAGIVGFNFQCNFDKHVGCTATAKRLRLEAQGCINLGVVGADHYQLGTGCAKGRNRVAVESAFNFVTQGSRSGNPGL